MNEADLRGLLFDPTVGRWVTVLVVIILVVALKHVVQRYVGARISDSTNRYRVNKGFTLLGYVLIVLALVTIFSDRLAGLTVAFGVAGAGIAFALQEVIASVAGWVAISFGRFYSPGDRVQLGGIKGDVIDIGILRTTLMEIGQWVDGDLYNGRIVRIANSYVFKDPVFNYSADLPFLWDEIKVPIRYGCDWPFAKDTLGRILQEECGQTAPAFRGAWDKAVQKYALEDARIDPLVTVVANDNWIEMTGRYIVDFRARRSTKDRIFTRWLEAVDGSGGRIKMASATYDLTGLPRLNVQFNGASGSVDPEYVP